MKSGDFLVWIQLHEPACHVEKHKKSIHFFALLQDINKEDQHECRYLRTKVSMLLIK